MTQFTDNFDRADGTPLGSGGDGWMIQTGGFSTFSNACRTTTDYATCAAMIDPGVAAFAETQYAECVLGALSADRFRGPAVRCAGAGAASVLYDFISYGGTSGRIYRLNSGGGATLIQTGYTVAEGNLLGLYVETVGDDVIFTPYINDVAQTQAVDSTAGRLLTGQPGQYGYYNNSSGIRGAVDAFFATDEFGGLTPVSNDLDLRWSILARVLNDADLRWSLNTLVFNDLDLRWSIIRRVSNDMDARWSLLARVINDADFRWAINSLVEGELDLRWPIRAQIGNDLDAQWSVIARVMNDIDLRWTLGILTRIKSMRIELVKGKIKFQLIEPKIKFELLS